MKVNIRKESEYEMMSDLESFSVIFWRKYWGWSVVVGHVGMVT